MSRMDDRFARRTSRRSRPSPKAVRVPSARWSRPQRNRMLYLRRLPWGRAAWLYGAVACTFCTLGFVVDLGRVTWLTPRFTVVAMAAWSGAIACLYVIAIVHRRSLFLLAIAAQIGLVYASNRILPVGTNPHRNPPTLRAIESQATFDAIGCLAAMVAGYTLFLAFISREGLRQVRLDIEIGLAREIHERLVPPFVRRVDGFELLGRSVPSSEAGGDLVDAFEAGGTQVAVVADVSGHGVPAQTLMAMVRAAMRARATAGGSLEESFAGIDRLLCDLERPDKFATAAALRLGRDGTGEVLLAGHLPVVVVRAGSHVVEHVENMRPPLGIPSAMTTSRIRHRPGDLFA